MAEETGGLDALLQNKLFLQYLSGMGADIASGGTGAAGANAITQQNIQAQNMAKMLKQFLGPDGTKATFSNAGINITVPKETELFSSLLGGSGPYKVNNSLATPSALSGGSNIVNPFVSSQSDYPSADLAGLTSQDIISAFGMKLKQDELKQQTINQAIDQMYKGQLIKESEARTALETPVYSIPGHPEIKLTPKQYLDYEKLIKENKPNEVKLYEYALGQGFKGSFMEFRDSAKTTHQKDYDAAVKGGYKGNFNDWMLAMAKAGALNLGEVVEREKAKKGVEAETYFSSGDFLKDTEKKLEKYRKDVLWNAPKGEKARKELEFKAKQAIDAAEARGYTVVRKYWLDNSMTSAAIDVVSKSGNKETIKLK